MQLNHEDNRLAALQSYGVLGSPREEDFDKITTMAARLFDAPLTCITLVDKERFFFKSTFGIDVEYLDRQPGFCDTTIQMEGVHCIEDASSDPVVQDHPLVCCAPYIRSYAGAPLNTPDGFAIGTICVMDPAVREFADSEKLLLQELSEFVMFHLDRRRLRAETAKRDERRRNIQKLESLGLLCGEIAHDFNNLLVGMLGNASLAAIQIDEDSPAQNTVADIVKAASQASELTDQLLAYAGQRPTSPRPIDIVQLIGNMSPLLRSSMSSDITLEFEQSDDLPAVLGDPTQLRQILFNLVTNASDAYCGGPGTVKLSFARIDLGTADGNDEPVPDLKAGSYVRIEVEDTGCGMDADTLNSIFSPFFTTKIAGRGLGMSIVQRIVSSHGGLIQVESELGRGCKVCILLPADTAADPGIPETVSEIKSMALGRTTALVVDDEELVIAITASTLKNFGLDTCSATSGEQAVEQARNVDAIGMLLLDATMPGMSGAATLDAIRALRPDLPAVITSGHHIDEVASSFQNFENLTFLQKPWTVEQLSDALCAAQRQQSQLAMSVAS